MTLGVFPTVGQIVVYTDHDGSQWPGLVVKTAPLTNTVGHLRVFRDEGDLNVYEVQNAGGDLTQPRSWHWR